MFSLNSIQTTKAGCVAYLSKLPCGSSLRDVITFSHSLCPELATYVAANENAFNSCSSRDKGAVGKMVEFYIFGQLPNSDPNPDLLWGADIKATHFKKMKDGYNAKERVTITNCGSTGKPETLAPIANAESLETCEKWAKIQKGVLFVFEHTSGKYLDIETNLSKRLLCAFPYDISELPENHRSQIATDFSDIQQKIRDGEVSQRGQKYLHIHPHGSKNSTTRAFGFTNKFVTELVSIKTGKPLTRKGRSLYIESHHFN
tara:strand:+ start:529 stop:1305 length:777 start_codon:yes stop_codon:yes gene_type:complete